MDERAVAFVALVLLAAWLLPDSPAPTDPAPAPAARPAPEPREASPEFALYLVREGDSLEQLASLFGVPPGDLDRLNALGGREPQPGQFLVIPVQPGGRVPWPPLPAPARPGDPPAFWEQVHRVAPGDTLFSIARRYGVSVAALAARNALSDPNVLEVGRLLVIPAPEGTREAGPAPGTDRSAPQRPPAFIWPVEGEITSGFGPRGGRMHNGLDVAAPAGTVIRAAAAGTVTFAGWRGGYGRLVVIDHGGGLETRYAHASALLARQGQRVAQGEAIARVGSSGQSTGPHLHFEVLVDGRYQDPLDWLPGFSP